MINVSEITIKRVKPQNGLVAFASCVINGIFYVGNIAIFDDEQRGQRIQYPTKVVRSLTATINEHVFKPITSEAGHNIEASILSVYNSKK